MSALFPPEGESLVPYWRCGDVAADGARCPLFIEENYRPDNDPNLARWVHLVREDEEDTHEALYSEDIHSLWWWKNFGPPEVVARFVGAP